MRVFAKGVIQIFKRGFLKKVLYNYLGITFRRGSLTKVSYKYLGEVLREGLCEGCHTNI